MDTKPPTKKLSNTVTNQLEQLEKEILERKNSLSTDGFHISFGELMSMYSNGELIIDPEFQRLFRWGIDQKTRFIESLLLRIPVPSIFVAEDSNGKWEIVDGLQRLSTIFSFFGMLRHAPDKNGWALESGDIISSLRGLKVSDLPIKYQLSIKRSVCRIEIVKWDNNYDMRYELFKRLNTGVTPFTDQEIRNCIFRGISVEFTNLIKDLASNQLFVDLIQPTQKQKDELYLDELVLRFFSLYQNYSKVNKNLSVHMTEYMKLATEGKVDYQHKTGIFNRVVSTVSTGGRSTLVARDGQLSTSLYDGIFNGVAENLGYYENHDIGELISKVEKLKEDEEFKKNSGVESNYKESVKRRIRRALEIFAPDE